jgi:hypothetical protein
MFAVLLTAALPARGAEPVAVRAGLHPGFGRVVLEWPAPVEVEGRQEQDRYRLRFGRPLEAVLAPALARLRDYLENARLSADARQLTLELAPGIAVRQRVEAERIVVLDLAPTLVPEQVAVRTGLHDGFARIVFHWPAPTAFDAVTTERRIAIRFDRAGHIDVTRPAARLAAWLAGAEASRSNGQSEVRLEMRPGVSAHVFRVDDERLAVDLRAAPARPAANGAGAASAAAAPAEARPSTVRPPVPAGAPAAPGTDRSEPVDPTSAAPAVEAADAVLEFAWAGSFGAAVFVRAGHLWVVSSGVTSPPEDLTVPPALRDDLAPGERVEASGGTAVRFALRRQLPVEARRENRVWRVRLSDDAQAPRPLAPLRILSPAGLRLAPGEAPRLVHLRDPDTGELLMVWPLLQPGLGQARQSYVDLELLATAQGLAWRLRSDRVRARIAGDAVEFDAPGGLALSAPRGGEPIRPTPPAEPPGNEPLAPAVGPGATAGPAPAVQAQPAPEPPPHERRGGARAAAAAPLLGLVGSGLDPAYTAPAGAALCCRRWPRRRRLSATRIASSWRGTI